MEDTWYSRELPVLDAIVRYFDEHLSAFPPLSQIAPLVPMDVQDVARAAASLNGPYIDLYKPGAHDPAGWGIVRVHPAARTAVGQWPSPESIVDRIVAGLTEAAEREPNEERKSKIRQVVDLLGGSLRDLTVDVAGAVIARQMGG